MTKIASPAALDGVQNRKSGGLIWCLFCLVAVGIGTVGGWRSPPQDVSEANKTDLKSLDLRVRMMDQAQLAELERKRDAFYALPESRQSQLRQFHQALEAHPESAQLLSTLKKYYVWYRSLNASDQPKITDEVDLEKRINIIRSIRRAQTQEANYLPFPKQDLELAENWLLEFAKSKEKLLRERFNQFARDNPRFAFVGDNSSRNELAPDILLRRLIFFSLRPGGENLLRDVLSDNDLEDLFGKFSAEGQTHVPKTRSERIRTFVGLATRPYVSDEDLQKFFVSDLTSEHRDYLDRLPPELMNRQLRFWYGEKKFLGRSPQLPGPNRRGR